MYEAVEFSWVFFFKKTHMGVLPQTTHVHFAAVIPERSSFYDMISGHFDLRKKMLKSHAMSLSFWLQIDID